MALTNSQYDSIIRKYDEKQIANRHQLDQRLQIVYTKIPGYRDIEDCISSVSVAQGKKMLLGDDSALPKLKNMLKDLSSQKERLLIENGFDKDYLSPIYECSDCKDTGYIDGHKCHCFKQAMLSFLYEQSNIKDLLLTENFSALSYDYYEGEDLSRFQKAVETAKNFIENFKSDYHNLFFYGTVGTGKSFLSCCIAKELIEDGHSVIYFSARQLFEVLSKSTFNYKDHAELQGIYEDLYECDLLIIDDLGTEMTNTFVTSQLFSCLNERYIRKNSTIISTNLSLEDLNNRYLDRIFSRITSNFDICKLTGLDIRMNKKRIANRK